jgi:hypothetical protein
MRLPLAPVRSRRQLALLAHARRRRPRPAIGQVAAQAQHAASTAIWATSWRRRPSRPRAPRVPSAPCPWRAAEVRAEGEHRRSPVPHAVPLRARIRTSIRARVPRWSSLARDRGVSRTSDADAAFAETRRTMNRNAAASNATIHATAGAALRRRASAPRAAPARPPSARPLAVPRPAASMATRLTRARMRRFTRTRELGHHQLQIVPDHALGRRRAQEVGRVVGRHRGCPGTRGTCRAGAMERVWRRSRHCELPAAIARRARRAGG